MQKHEADEAAKLVEKLIATADDLRSKGKSPLAVLFNSVKDGAPFRVLNLNTICQIWGEWFVPYLALLLTQELLSRKTPGAILDPTANNGLFLACALQATGAKHSRKPSFSRADWYRERLDTIGRPSRRCSFPSSESFQRVIGSLSASHGRVQRRRIGSSRHKS
jgi:hypothetical protein